MPYQRKRLDKLSGHLRIDRTKPIFGRTLSVDRPLFTALDPVCDLFHSKAYHDFHEDLSSCSHSLQRGLLEILSSGSCPAVFYTLGNKVQDTFS